MAVRYLDKGYQAIAITDHTDYSNIINTVTAILNFTKHWPKNSALQVLPGIELTHLPLEQFKSLAAYARKKGIKVIVAHGETPVEPIIKGTNLAALQADIDILAHPGLIQDKEVKLARDRGVFLEITSRHGHARANKHVVRQALKFGAKLILNNDSHSPEDIISPQELEGIARDCGLSDADIAKIYRDTQEFLKAKGA